jgi:hypothetical protein
MITKRPVGEYNEDNRTTGGCNEQKGPLGEYYKFKGV